MIQPLINITRQQALCFAAFLVCFEFLVYIANDMIMPGMLAVIQTFHAPESAVASSLTAYLLGGASLLLLLGPLSDHFGRRPVMLVGAGWFALMTLLVPLSQSILQFLLLRFFEGMGLCFINVIGYALLHEIFCEKDAILLISIMVNVATLAPLLGPLAGAEFLQYTNWQAIFYLIGGLAVLTFYGLYRYMPESVGQRKHDGQLIRRTRWTLGSMIANYKALITDRVFAFGSVAYGLMGVTCVVWIALSPLLLVTIAHLSLVEYGLLQIPVFGAFILGNGLLTYGSLRYSARQLSWMGSILVILGTILMGILPFLWHHPVTSLFPGLVVYAIGYGIGATALNRFILFVTQVTKGSTSALIATCSMSCQALGLAIANYCFAGQKIGALCIFIAVIGLLYMICVLISFAKSDKTLVLK